LATVAVIEGVGNLILSIALVWILRHYVVGLGIVGDAVGTAIPLTCTMLYFTPRHMRRQLGVPVRTFLREAYALPLVLVVPFTAVLLLMRNWFYAHHLWQLATQVAAGGAVYGLGLLWAYKTKRATHIGELAERAPEPVETQPVPTLPSGYGEEV